MAQVQHCEAAKPSTAAIAPTSARLTQPSNARRHDVRVRVAQLLDGEELRSTSCCSELVVVRDYDGATGRAGWELESLEDDYDDDRP